MVFMLFSDQNDRFHRNRFFLFNEHFDSIGIACDCDPVWGEKCIIELGREVTPLMPLEYNHDEGDWELQQWLWDESYRGEDWKEYNGPCLPEMPDYLFCLSWDFDYGFTRRNLDASYDFLP